jgi:hypothetical protein
MFPASATPEAATSPSPTRLSATGPDDLVFLPFVSGLWWLWTYPHFAPFANRLAQSSRLVLVNTRGGKVAGIGVSTGARVAAVAAPGEVLVSPTVKAPVPGSGIEFEDRGTHELKGVPGEWRLFAVSPS